MKIVMTGASGFVGQAWLAKFGSQHEIYSIGRTPPQMGTSDNLVHHVNCDLSTPGELKSIIGAGQLPKDVDLVLHLAVSALHRTFPTTASDMFEVNVSSTAALLDYAYSVGSQQFVLGSSGSVYDGCVPGSLQETTRLDPQRYFPASKFAAELLAREYRSYLKICTLRFFTPYGPNQTNRLIPDLISRVKQGHTIDLPLEGPGINFSMTYIDDAIKIINTVLESQWDGTFNVAQPSPMSIQTVAQTIASIQGREPVFSRSASVANYKMVPDLSLLANIYPIDEMIRPQVGLAQTIVTYE